MSNHVDVSWHAYVRDVSIPRMGVKKYEVQLLIGGYLVARWDVEDHDYWTFKNDEAHLRQFVAGKFYTLFRRAGV